MNDFFKRIEELLKQQKKTQKELSQIMGLSAPQAYITQRNRGSYPNAYVTVKIAKYLNTTVEYLVTGNDTSPLESEIKNLQSKIDQIAKIINEK